jgi:hypothetical protein
MTRVGHVARIGEMRNVYKILVGKPEGKTPLGRTRRRREDTEIDVRDTVWGCGLDSIHIAEDRDQWRALYEHGNEPSGFIKGEEFLD